jgi:hypothetical protein
MPTSLPVKEIRLRGKPKRADPRLLFGAALVLTVSGAAAAARVLPEGWMIPLGATLLFALAGAMALLAWRRRDSDPQQVNCWDVAGALTLIGICAAATIEPEQLVSLVDSSRHKP